MRRHRRRSDRGRRRRARPHRVLRHFRRPAGRPRRADHRDRRYRRHRERRLHRCQQDRDRPCAGRCRRRCSSRSASPCARPSTGTCAMRRMRMHTALHLLSAVLPYPVTGGAVGDSEGRLDFDIPEAGLDKDEITGKLTEMIAADAAVRARWITDAELDGQSRPGQDHVGQAADGHRPGPPGRDRRHRSAALRRHPCARDRRDRRRARHRRSRRRASRTAACGSRLPDAGTAESWQRLADGVASRRRRNTESRDVEESLLPVGW